MSPLSALQDRNLSLTALPHEAEHSLQLLHIDQTLVVSAEKHHTFVQHGLITSFNEFKPTAPSIGLFQLQISVFPLIAPEANGFC
jgi:hypothetical protein